MYRAPTRRKVHSQEWLCYEKREAKSKSPWFGSAHHRLRRNGPYGTPVFPNETNPGVPSLLLEQGVKECPAFLSPKAAARSG